MGGNRGSHFVASNRKFSGTMALSLFICVSLGACKQKEEAAAPVDVVRPVKMLTVNTGQESLGRNLPGRVRASKQVEMSFQVDGTLTEFPVSEGQTVARGDLLARLDPRDFEVSLRNAQSQLERAQAMVRLATVEYDRLERVRKADAGAVAQSHLDRAMENKAMAQADVSGAEAAVDEAKLQMSYTYLKAPFAGMVSSRAVDNFQEVRAKQPILTMDDLAVVEVMVEIPESLMAPVREPGSFQVFAEFAPAPGKRYPLILKEFSVRGDPKTLTYQVTYQMDQPGEGINILPGMTANVFAEPKQASGPLPVTVPAVAVFTKEGKSPQVWVLNPDDMTVHARDVKTGNLSGSDSIEIAEGLQNGETVVVSAVSQLREGQKVQRFE